MNFEIELIQSPMLCYTTLCSKMRAFRQDETMYLRVLKWTKAQTDKPKTNT